MYEAFNRLLYDLRDYYGGKAPTNPRVIEQYRRAVEFVPEERSSELFERIVNGSSYFPKLKEFKEFCEPFVKRRESTFTDGCIYCLDSGLIKYTREVKGLPYRPEYFAACVCERGRALKSRYILGFDELFGDDGLKTVKSRNQAFLSGSSPEKAKAEALKSIAGIGQKRL